MSKGSVMAINKSRGTVISCRNGSIWLTEPGSGDIYLKGGDSYKILSGNKIVMQAISDCSFEIN